MNYYAWVYRYGNHDYVNKHNSKYFQKDKMVKLNFRKLKKTAN